MSAERDEAHREMELVSSDGSREPVHRRIRRFVLRVYSKAMEDNIYFMAGAITFNLLVVMVPLLLLIVGFSGYALQARSGDPASVALPILVELLPAVGGEVDLVHWLRDTVNRVVEERAGLSVVGAVIFIWISTRLVGTLRTVLREVFDVAQDRGIVAGKIFDFQAVVLGTGFVVVNLGVTVVLEAVGTYGVSLLGLQQWDLTLVRRGAGMLLSFVSIWVLFLLIYRYLLIRRIPWRTALVSASFTAVMHELMKAGFGWYTTAVADFRSVFGNLATAAILFIWIYYESVVFILGGEVGQVYTMNRVRRIRVREVFDGEDA